MMASGHSFLLAVGIVMALGAGAQADSVRERPSGYLFERTAVIPLPPVRHEPRLTWNRPADPVSVRSRACSSLGCPGFLLLGVSF
jgi:hypothetical protein